jgi:hypothetical protein
VSLPDSTDPGRVVVVHKPKANIYTVLLGISLLAIIMAIIFLCMEMSRYNWDIKAAGARAVGMTPAGMTPAGMTPTGMTPTGMTPTKGLSSERLLV